MPFVSLFYLPVLRGHRTYRRSLLAQLSEGIQFRGHCERDLVVLGKGPPLSVTSHEHAEFSVAHVASFEQINPIYGTRREEPAFAVFLRGSHDGRTSSWPSSGNSGGKCGQYRI
eukprot:1191360-Prorocentrum_minimum.AAC.3